MFLDFRLKISDVWWELSALGGHSFLPQFIAATEGAVTVKSSRGWRNGIKSAQTTRTIDYFHFGNITEKSLKTGKPARWKVRPFTTSILNLMQGKVDACGKYQKRKCIRYRVVFCKPVKTCWRISTHKSLCRDDLGYFASVEACKHHQRAFSCELNVSKKYFHAR